MISGKNPVRQIQINTYAPPKSEGSFLHLSYAIERNFVSLWCTIYFSEKGIIVNTNNTKSLSLKNFIFYWESIKIKQVMGFS